MRTYRFPNREHHLVGGLYLAPNVVECEALLHLTWVVLGSNSQLVHLLPWFPFSFLRPSSQSHNETFRLGHNHLQPGPSLHSYTALDPADFHLFEHVKNSTGSRKPEEGGQARPEGPTTLLAQTLKPVHCCTYKAHSEERLHRVAQKSLDTNV